LFVSAEQNGKRPLGHPDPFGDDLGHVVAKLGL
jgi:hypothetical protein